MLVVSMADFASNSEYKSAPSFVQEEQIRQRTPTATVNILSTFLIIFCPINTLLPEIRLEKVNYMRMEMAQRCRRSTAMRPSLSRREQEREASM